MQKQEKFTISLKGGAISINELEITPDVAARVLRLMMPLSNEVASEIQHNSEDGSQEIKDNVDVSKMSAKAFMVLKQPKGDVERITALAYYQTKYKGAPQFKTIDLTHLNREAAQPGFSNPSVAARNAVSQQYLALAGGGKKQISPRGEAVVEALPDRGAVKKATESLPLHGNKRKTIKAKTLKKSSYAKKEE